MVKLFIKEVAEERGMNMSKLQLAAKLPMSTVQRYWHGRGVKGEFLTSVDLRHLDTLCDVLECAPGDLLRQVRDVA